MTVVINYVVCMKSSRSPINARNILIVRCPFPMSRNLFQLDLFLDLPDCFRVQYEQSFSWAMLRYNHCVVSSYHWQKKSCGKTVTNYCVRHFWRFLKEKKIMHHSMPLSFSLQLHQKHLEACAVSGVKRPRGFSMSLLRLYACGRCYYFTRFHKPKYRVKTLISSIHV